MELSKWTPKVAAFVVMGTAITILLMNSVAKLWRHDFKTSIWSLALGAVMAVIFFRTRKIALVSIALSFICVTVGMATLFHPTTERVLITLGSIVGMYALALWGARKYPHLRGKDWKTLFDQDPEPAPRVDEKAS